MSNAAEATTHWNCPNYLGELFVIGAQAKQTPFLTMVGGLNGGKNASAFEFPLGQSWALENAAQPAITETASLTAPTPTTYVRGQAVNTAQIFQEQVSVSYVKLSQPAVISGLALEGSNPVQNELDFQIMANLMQIAKDVNYTFLNGAYVKATDAGTAAKTKGIITGTTTNAVAAGTVALSKALMDTLFRTMADNGAQFVRPVIFCDAIQVQRLSDLYGFAPMDRNIGGVNVSTIIAPLVGQVSVMWDRNVPDGTLLLADVAFCQSVSVPVPGKGHMFYEPLAKTGAGESGMIYGQIGLDYGMEQFHGKITGLTYA